MEPMAEITVTYRTKDGWHLFTSDQMDGLVVASPDLRTAFDDVPKAVSMLLKLDHGFECVVQPRLDYEGFCALLGARETPRRPLLTRFRKRGGDEHSAFLRDAFPFVVTPPCEGYRAAASA